MAYVTLTEIYAHRQRSNALDLLIEPNPPSLWGIGTFGLGHIGKKIPDKVMAYMNRIMSYTMMFIVPLLFEGLAYYSTFAVFGAVER